jgi:hypothetical protein
MIRRAPRAVAWSHETWNGPRGAHARAEPSRRPTVNGRRYRSAQAEFEAAMTERAAINGGWPQTLRLICLRLAEHPRASLIMSGGCSVLMAAVMVGLR